MIRRAIEILFLDFPIPALAARALLGVGGSRSPLVAAFFAFQNGKLKRHD